MIFSKDITKKDLIEICSDLTKEFSFNHTFSPDLITDEGITFTSLSKDQYKSFRFCYDSWSWINNIEESNHSNDVIFKNGKIQPTFLRASRVEP